MPLKDPPSYVGLDPALIYGVHDLQQKTYQRLLQLIGWMWVTRKTGSPLGTSVQELAERWDIAERTVYHTLQALDERGYIKVTYAHGRAYITKSHSCRHYMLGEPAATQQIAGGDAQQAGGAVGDKPREAVEIVGAKNLHYSSGVVVVGSGSKESGSLQPQPTTKSAVQLTMEKGGMFEDKAAELATDPWVTEERVTLWIEQLVQDKAVRSVGAVLYSNLKAHREPPGAKAQDDYWRRSAEEKKRRSYIEGEWADIIEH